MRIVVVADNLFVAEAIRRNVRHATALRVLGWVDGRNPCAAQLVDAAPDAVVVDEMSRPGCAAARVAEARAALPDAKIVVLASRMSPDWLAEVVDAGAHAAIVKTVQAVNLGVLIREVCAGSVYHSFANEAPTAVARAHADLTPRELEILRLVAQGASNAAIARRLWVTEQTIKFHLSNVYRKLGVANRTEASHYAHVNRLVEPLSLAATAATAARNAA